MLHTEPANRNALSSTNLTWALDRI